MRIFSSCAIANASAYAGGTVAAGALTMINPRTLPSWNEIPTVLSPCASLPTIDAVVRHRRQQLSVGLNGRTPMSACSTLFGS